MSPFEQAITNWDRAAFVAINHDLKSRPLDLLMPHVSDLGLGHVQVLLILVAALLLAIRAREIHLKSAFRDSLNAIVKRRAWVGPLLVAFVISGIGATLFKNTIHRDRPWWFYLHEHSEGREQNVEVYTVASRHPIRVRGFLSGHSATSFAIAMTLTLLNFRKRRARVWLAGAWLLALLIGISRIYIADHWPVDVVCGAILGILSGFAALWVCRRWADRESIVRSPSHNIA